MLPKERFKKPENPNKLKEARESLRKQKEEEAKPKPKATKK